MSVSTTEALVERAPATEELEDDVKLTIPEATMFIVGTSGALWVLLFGAFKAAFG